ncbi:MAG: hypothetical protein R2705_22850 [Ilumatobacteraceae bacterium]
MAKRTFHAGDDGVGLLLGARRRGRDRSAHRRPARRAQGGSAPAALRDGRGVVGGVLPRPQRRSTLAVGAIVVLIGHLGGGAQWTLSTYGLQRQVPDEIRGRVLAGDSALVMVTLTLSNLAAGATVGLIGPGLGGHLRPDRSGRQRHLPRPGATVESLVRTRSRRALNTSGRAHWGRSTTPGGGPAP